MFACCLNAAKSARYFFMVWGAFVAGGVGFEPTTTSLGGNIQLDWVGFKQYLDKKYSKGYADECYRYARAYVTCLNSPIQLETLNGYKRNNVLKSLIALAKYHGFYEAFKGKLKTYGLKWHKQNSLTAFLRILNNSNSDILTWYKKTLSVSDDGLKTFFKFALCSGLRRTEAIESFNLIIKLSKTQGLDGYYNKSLNTLEHFRFPQTFLRITKNAFVSIVPEELVTEITLSKPLTFEALRKRLQRRGVATRINELRDYYGTFMVRHGLIREEVDLLQGRISSDVFVRHYWSPSFTELRDRTLKALNELLVILF
jgi:intergrase/recombinase